MFDKYHTLFIHCTKTSSSSSSRSHLGPSRRATMTPYDGLSPEVDSTPYYLRNG